MTTEDNARMQDTITTLIESRDNAYAEMNDLAARLDATTRERDALAKAAGELLVIIDDALEPGDQPAGAYLYLTDYRITQTIGAARRTLALLKAGRE